MNLKQISDYANLNKIMMACRHDYFRPFEFTIRVLEKDVEEVKEYFNFRGQVGIKYIIIGVM